MVGAALARKLLVPCCALLACSAWAAPALALTVDISTKDASLVGDAFTFRAAVQDAVGVVQYRWSFGDGTPRADYAPDAGERPHVYAQPGHFYVQLSVQDEESSSSVIVPHLVHYLPKPQKPTASSSIVYDKARGRVYAVNQDSDSVTSIDAVGLTKVAELPVYRRPEALALTAEGKLWIVHKDDYAVAVVDPDRFVIEKGFRLPYASQPIGLAMSPAGREAYITLMAVGKLLKLDSISGQVMGELDVGPWPRGVSVSHDGKDVYVTRFISPDTGGELVHVDGPGMGVVKRIQLVPDREIFDTDRAARGLPNYLFGVGLSPDGRQAWVAGKKDNIFRGPLRDGLDLTQDDTVRPMVAIVDLAQGAELPGSRVDLDDRSLPAHVEFNPLGDFAFVTVAASNLVEVRSVYEPGTVWTIIASAGVMPRATVLGPQNRLFVQAALGRSVLVFDVGEILVSFQKTTPTRLAEISTVQTEKLDAQVLLGKRVFHGAADVRMTSEGYLTCGTCHFEGIDDGRVYDFSTRGEGLRNTVSLLGRKGVGHGRVNWSGNLDEIQDFEMEIRELFGGRGFIANDVLAMGTRSEPLGDAKAGSSVELDALAAYLKTLDQVSPSPFRTSTGAMTSAAQAGKALFGKLGCAFCHGGGDGTDSAKGMLHDVGTLTPSSGKRLGGVLTGIDTPTLLGVWETAPYLHDGSAATLRDVLTTRNTRDQHGSVSLLKSEEIDQLVAYLRELDSEIPVRRLPFEPAMPAGTDGGDPDGGVDAGMTRPDPDSAAGCGCGLSGEAPRTGPGSTSLSISTVLLALALALARMGRRRVAGAGRVAVVALGLALASTACNPATQGPTVDRDASMPSSWASLPQVVAPDPELAPLATRQAQYDKLCATPRGDSFWKAICGGGRRPDIPDLASLLKLVGLQASRAFALTGNSTSLVSRSVSALNPRIIVFPRVDETLQRSAELTAIGFVRGEQFVELVSRDATTGDYNFYLLSFEQSCNYQGQGCDLASLLTEEVEHQWTAYSIYDQQDLERTSFDCRSCHQPGGFGSRQILRMQELTSPWLHWFPQRFVQRTESDRVLLAQFTESHANDEQYGGIPTGTIANAVDEGSGAQLEALIRAEGFGDQPNPFDGSIAAEAASGDTSSTWQARFEVTLRGEAIAVPYPRIDVSDEAKRLAAARSYREVSGGMAPREGLVDIRQVFSQDAEEKLGFVPKPAADGRTVLLQMCSRCHDGRANPALTRSRFNVLELDRMSRTEKDLAITRIEAAGGTKMPPWRVGRLTPESLEAATSELQK